MADTEDYGDGYPSQGTKLLAPIGRVVYLIWLLPALAVLADHFWLFGGDFTVSNGIPLFILLATDGSIYSTWNANNNWQLTPSLLLLISLAVYLITGMAVAERAAKLGLPRRIGLGVTFPLVGWLLLVVMLLIDEHSGMVRFLRSRTGKPARLIWSSFGIVAGTGFGVFVLALGGGVLFSAAYGGLDVTIPTIALVLIALVAFVSIAGSFFLSPPRLAPTPEAEPPP